MPMSIDLLCDWGERMQVTPLRLQVGRVYNQQEESFHVPRHIWTPRVLQLLIEDRFADIYPASLSRAIH